MYLISGEYEINLEHFFLLDIFDIYWNFWRPSTVVYGLHLLFHMQINLYLLRI